MGRSRGGFRTKIHVAANGLGLPVKLILTPGQASDVGQAKARIDGVPFEVGIADKGYDSQEVAMAIEDAGAEVVIPSWSNVKPISNDSGRHFWKKCDRYTIDSPSTRKRRSRELSLRRFHRSRSPLPRQRKPRKSIRIRK